MSKELTHSKPTKSETDRITNEQSQIRALAGTGFTPPGQFIGPIEVPLRQSAFFQERRTQVVLSPEGRSVKGPFSKRWETWNQMTERELVLEEEEAILKFLKQEIEFER